MTATYTFDVFATLDGFGSYNSSGDWGGYWGKQGPEFLDRRLAQYNEDQRLVLGATTFREFMHFLGPASQESPVNDPINTRMKTMPTTVVSSTLHGPLDWPDATVVSGDAVDIVARLKEESEVPLRSHGPRQAGAQREPVRTDAVERLVGRTIDQRRRQGPPREPLGQRCVLVTALIR